MPTSDDRDGYDRLADSWTARGEKMAGNLADHPGRTVAKWIGLIVAACIAISLITGVIGWASGWWDAGKQVVSADNAKTQSYQVRDLWNAMLTDAGNACQASGSTATSDPNLDPQIVGGAPALTYANLYRQHRSAFNRIQRNPFENGITHYAGYPTHVKIFPGELTPKPNWCAITQQLQDMHE